jgi:hypothetical protein
MPSTNTLFELSESQKRQYIDAETVFLALAQATKSAAEVRGSMFWRELKGTRTLIRSSAAGAQKSLGAHSETTQKLFDTFTQRKTTLEERVSALKGQLRIQQRLNRALRVGRVPNIVVNILNHFEKAGLQRIFWWSAPMPCTHLRLRLAFVSPNRPWPPGTWTCSLIPAGGWPS